MNQRYENADICKICKSKKMINGFCEHCEFTDITMKKPAPLAHIVNRQSPSNDSVYVSGIKKLQLDKIVGYKTISVQIINNWIFLIKRSDLIKLNL